MRVWRPSLALTLVGTCLAIAASIWMHPIFSNDPTWFQAGDLWVHMRAGSYAASGAVLNVYEAHPAFVAMPGYALVLAPPAALSDTLRLVEGLPNPVSQPSAWLPLLTWAMGLSFVLYLGAGRLMTTSTRDRRLVVLTMASMFPLVVIPAGFLMGHLEDVLVLGLLFLATAAIVRERHMTAALFVALALCLKQTTLLAVPLLLLQVPRADRIRWLVYVLGPAAVLAIGALAVDWPHASKALLGAETFPELGHPLPWIPDTGTVAAGPWRLLAIAFAVGVALWIGHTRSTVHLVAALAVVFLARLPAEPVWHAYYLSTALGFALVHEAMSSGRVWRTAWGGVACLAWFLVRPPDWLWFPVLLGLGAFTFWHVVRTTVTARRAVWTASLSPLVGPDGG